MVFNLGKLKVKNFCIYTAILFIYATLLLCSLDTDMLFTVASGNDILKGNFNFNTATNLPIVVQQWLYAVIIALIDNNFGYVGDIFFVFIQNLLLWIVSYKFLSRRSKKIAIVCPIILTLLSSSYMINIRPELITMIILVSELNVLDKYEENKDYKQLFLLIPIFLLMANFHQAVYLYAIFLMIPYMDKNIFIVAIITPIFSLFTPYGINGSLYIFKSFLSNTFNLLRVNEMQPMKIFSLNGIILILMMLTIIYLNYIHRSNKFINFFGISVFILTISAIRHSSIIYIPLLFIASQLRRFPTINLEKALCAILCATSIFTIFLVNIDTVINDLGFNKYTKVAEQLDIPKNAKIFNDINLGSALEYYGYNTYIDMRPELYNSYYNNDRLNTYFKMTYFLEDNKAVSTIDVLTEVNNFDYLIVLKNSRLDALLKEFCYVKVDSIEMYNVWKVGA